MHTHISGEGQPVLFLHGGGVSGWMWRPVIEGLPSGIRAIVPDLPGHGKSKSAEYESHDTTIAELVALITEKAPQGALVVGFSLGAQLALRLASTQPELVHAAIIVSGEARPAPLQALTLWLLKKAGVSPCWPRVVRPLAGSTAQRAERADERLPAREP